MEQKVKATKTVFLATVLFVVSAMSQTLVYSKKGSTSASNYVQAMDVEAIQYEGYASSYKYQGFLRNDTITVFDLVSGVNEYSVKVPQIDLSQTTKICYVYAFKNLFQSDNQWSIALWWYNSSNSTTLAIYANGVEKFRKVSTNAPGWYKSGGSFYMETISSLDTTISFYSLRSSLSSRIVDYPEKAVTAQIIRNGDICIAMIPTTSGGTVSWQLFKVNGGLVKESEEKSNGELALLKIDMEDIGYGTYILKANTGTNVFINTLVK